MAVNGLLTADYQRIETDPGNIEAEVMESILDGSESKLFPG